MVKANTYTIWLNHGCLKFTLAKNYSCIYQSPEDKNRFTELYWAHVLKLSVGWCVW